MTEQNPWRNLVAGGVGGVATAVSGHPFDTVKVRLQTHSLLGSTQRTYRNALDCSIKILKGEGIRGFYKGLGAPIAIATPSWALGFLGYEIGKDAIRWYSGNYTNKLSLLEVFFAGALSGAFAAAVVAPGERMKCILQIQSEVTNKKYSGLWDCFKTLYRTGGITSIYRGIMLTLFREIFGNGAFFATVEYIKRKFPEEETLNIRNTILAAGTGGMVFWVIGMPVDVLKSKFQTAPDGRYNAIVDVVKEIARNDGLKGFYRGFGPAILRAFPSHACCFVAYEQTLRLFETQF
uniref:mitochondrial carnitine/acylcarnitine carrier protein-like n=1 Tax=Styela clava TaxID=7725 RepID=UPI00193A2026|nr:mitochondrial carnitine/acylcarnitine carrier protein-like [Styela clava]